MKTLTEKLQISRNKTRINGLDISPEMFAKAFNVDHLADKSLENGFYTDENKYKRLEYYEVYNSSGISGFLEHNINYNDVLIIVSDKTYSNFTGIKNVTNNEEAIDIPENIQRKLKLYARFASAQVYYLIGFSAFVKDKKEYFEYMWDDAEFQDLLKYMAENLDETIQ